MKLHQLSPTEGRRHRRIGRSGKRGSYSGRGVKGQKSRSGRRLRPAERDLILRLPKRRGFANLPKSDKVLIFNLDELSKHLKSFVKSGSMLELNKDLLKVAELLKKDFKGKVKILGNGEIQFPISVSGIKVSKGAKIKIEKAAGKVA